MRQKIDQNLIFLLYIPKLIGTGILPFRILSLMFAGSEENVTVRNALFSEAIGSVSVRFQELEFFSS